MKQGAKDKAIEIDGVLYIPFAVQEASEARHSRERLRIIIAFIVGIVMLIAINAIAWCQYDYTSESVVYSQDGNGNNNINNGTQGGVDYGTENGSEAQDAP